MASGKWLTVFGERTEYTLTINKISSNGHYEKLRGKRLCCELVIVFLGLPRFSGARRRECGTQRTDVLRNDTVQG